MTASIVLLPNRELDPKRVRTTLARWLHSNNNVQVATVVLVRVPRTRFLWRELEPAIFAPSSWFTCRPSRICALLEVVLQCCDFEIQAVSLPETTNPQPTNAHSTTTSRPWAQYRRLSSSFSKTIVWIEPAPQPARLETAWTGRLLHWEHLLIRAQSLTGYLATLGGGFFLCHHFQTAMTLARQQQQLALYLNDYGMYYRCVIHTAYSCIYHGRFGQAQRLIRFVQQQAPTVNDPALSKMCTSALLFRRRVRKAAKFGSKRDDSDQNDGGVSKTIDDFARIRVVEDRSLRNDLAIPFGDFRMDILKNYSNVTALV